MSKESKVWTKIECRNCKNNAKRLFTKGDYVEKVLGYPCPYCLDLGNEFQTLVIIAIYKE